MATGHLDLVIVGTVAVAGTQLFIAYGIGDGTFSSSPTLSPVDNVAANFSGANALFTVITGQTRSDLPLAIADLNHDKILDYVFPSSIYFSEPLTLGDGGASGNVRYVQVAGSPDAVSWTSAVIADVNRDGIPDVAATNPTGSIDFFLGTGSEATSYLSYGLDGVPTNLVAGDFDGDLVNDLAFSVSGVAEPDAGASSSEIEVLFGQQEAFPAQPVSLGTSPSVVGLVAGPLAVQYTGTTPPTDTNVSSMVALTVDASSNEYAAILLGNTARIITSGFSLTPTTGPRGFAVRGATGPTMVAKQDDLTLLARDTPTAAGTTTMTATGTVTTPPNYSFWYAPSTGEATLSSLQTSRKDRRSRAITIGKSWRSPRQASTRRVSRRSSRSHRTATRKGHGPAAAVFRRPESAHARPGDPRAVQLRKRRFDQRRAIARRRFRRRWVSRPFRFLPRRERNHGFGRVLG